MSGISGKEEKRMSVTIHDVAKRAGVSHTTVSWTIHDHPGITEETKNKFSKLLMN